MNSGTVLDSQAPDLKEPGSQRQQHLLLEAQEQHSPGDREHTLHGQHMVRALQNKLRLICDRGGDCLSLLASPPPLILIAESGEGACVVRPGYCQAQFAMTFIFQ